MAINYSLQEVKSFDLVTYLKRLGFEATKISGGKNYWYLSPFRNEATPSFKVNTIKNCWYDHGIGKGGNLIDFGILFYDCDVAGFLKRFNEDFSFHQQPHSFTKCETETLPNETKINVISTSELTDFRLIHYLKNRAIALNVARQFCVQLTYHFDGRVYVGIGFKNDAGGFEIRNAFCKTSSSPKDITLLKNESDTLCVFEGFSDFLSYKTMQKDSHPNEDYLVLNTASFIEKVLPIIEGYNEVDLYFDNDDTGKKLTEKALAVNPKYTDKSELYKGCNDLNDWLIGQQNIKKPRMRL